MDTIYYIAPPIFFGIAFLFSMLGMGGAQLYIPILYWLGMDFKTEAIPLGLLLNIVNSSSASVVYIRKHLTDLHLGLAFGIPMVVFAPLGTWVNIGLSTKLIILIFALFTAAAAGLILSGWRPKQGEPSLHGKRLLGLASGGVLGFFTGLIGRGTGEWVTTLSYLAGLDAKAAVATSAMAITFSCTSGFLSHLATAAQPRWDVWLLCAAAVLAGSQTGSRFMAGRLNAQTVRLVFGYVLIGVAAFLIVKDVIL